MDAVAATAALDAIFFSDQIDTGAINPQMQEAFELAFPGRDLYQRLEELNVLTPESREAIGFLNTWKGKYLEVIVIDKLNAGESVAGIQLGPGQVARLFPNLNHPGSDVEILNADGTVAEELQVKATESVSYVKQAIEKYPSIRIVTPDDVEGITDADLEGEIAAPVEELFDTPLEEFVEMVLPGLPFVLIATTEGAKILIGRQTLQQAMNRSLERATKTGAAMSVGALLVLVDAGVVSLPATFLTRTGIDRYRINRGILRRLDADTTSVQSLLPAHANPSLPTEATP